MNPRAVAALWVLASTFAFSLVFASGKLMGGLVPVLQIVLIRYASGFLVASAATQLGGQGWRRAVTTDRRWLHLLRALCGASGGGATIYAAMHMPLADTAALGLTQGLFVVILALAFLRERVSAVQWIATLLCGLGALIVVRGETGTAGFSIGLAPLFAVLGALLMAGEIVLIKVLSARESALTMLLHVNGFGTLLLLLPAALLWQPMDITQIALLSLLGPLALSGQWFNVQAYRRADAAFLAPFGYTYVIFAALIGFMNQGETPGITTWLGSTLIVAGGLLLLRGGKKPA